MIVGSLPRMDVTGRLPRLRQRIADEGCEAVLVTNLKNIRYLTGFTGSAALLLVLPDELVFATDGRYETQSADQLATAGVEARFVVGNVAGQRDSLSEAAGSIRKLGLEASSVSWAAQRSYDTEWFPTADLVPTTGLVEELRRGKDDGEVARLAEAAPPPPEAPAGGKPPPAGAAPPGGLRP